MSEKDIAFVTKKPIVALEAVAFFEHPLVKTVAITFGEGLLPAPDGNKPFSRLQAKLQELFVGKEKSERTLDHIRAFIDGYADSLVKEGVIGEAFKEDFVQFVFSIVTVG